MAFYLLALLVIIYSSSLRDNLPITSGDRCHARFFPRPSQNWWWWCLSKQTSVDKPFNPESPTQSHTRRLYILLIFPFLPFHPVWYRNRRQLEETFENTPKRSSFLPEPAAASISLVLSFSWMQRTLRARWKGGRWNRTRSGKEHTFTTGWLPLSRYIFSAFHAFRQLLSFPSSRPTNCGEQMMITAFVRYLHFQRERELKRCASYRVYWEGMVQTSVGYYHIADWLI